MHTHRSNTAGIANDSLIGQLLDEFTDRLHAGEELDIEAQLARHPDVAATLRPVLEALRSVYDVATEEVLEHGSTAGSASPRDSRRIGDFRILQELGRGGMGVVYEAEQISLDRRVALKVLPFAGALDQRQLQRFKNEAKAAASLHHPNIVPVFGIGCDRGVHYYAMQHIEGQTLAQVLTELEAPDGRAQAQSWELIESLSAGKSSAAEHGSPANRGLEPSSFRGDSAAASDTKRSPHAALSTQRSTRSSLYFRSVAELGIQVAGALSHAHDEGIVHRDIKPSNLILDDRGKVWVTDFGLARVEANPELTMTGDIVGTLRYMSPEQALGKRVVIDERTDIYSLCATLYEMLTLLPVFAENDRQQLFRQIAFEEPRRPRSLDRAIPSELETIVLKGIEKNPEQRYETVQELADDLRRFLQEQPIRARPPTLVNRALKWSRRHPSIVGSAVAVLLVIVIAMTTSTVLLTQEARRVRKQWLRAEQAEAASRRSELLATRAASRSEDAAATAQAINRFLTDFVLVRADPLNGSAAQQAVFRAALDNASSFADRLFPDDPALKSALHQTIARVYSRLGDYEKSATHFRAALVLSRVLDLDDPVVLEIRTGLGHALCELDQLDEAEDVLRQGIQLGLRLLGETAPLTLAAKQNLALVLARQGRLTQAVALAKECFEALKQLRGQDDPDTATAAVGLAHVLAMAGKADNAAKLLIPAIQVLQDRPGVEDPGTQRAMSDLATIDVRNENFESAEALRRTILQTRVRVQGPNHSRTLAALSDVAELLVIQGRLPEAEHSFHQILRARQRELGINHPDTQVTVGRLAKVLWKQGKLREAANMYGGYYVTTAASPSDVHPDGLSMVNEHAIVLQSLGRHAEAERMLRNNLDVARETLGTQHLTTQTCVVRLLISLLAQRKFAEAFPLGTASIPVMRSIDDENPRTLSITGFPRELAMKAFADRQRPDPWIESSLRTALTDERATLPAAHLATADTLATLGRVLLATHHKLDEAEQLLRESLSIRQAALPPGNWLLAETESLLGSCLAQRERFNEAQPLLEQSYQTVADAPDVPDALKLELLQRIITLNNMWGKTQRNNRWRPRLEELLRACLQDWGSSFPSDHKLIVDLQIRLADCLSALERHEQAEELLLGIYATQGIANSWFYHDPYPSKAATGAKNTHENLEAIIRLYESWGRSNEAGDWRELHALHPVEGKKANVDCHKAGIALWTRISDAHGEMPYRIRLSRAYSDLGLTYLRTGEAAESVVWFDMATDLLQSILAEAPGTLWAREQLAANWVSQAEALKSLGGPYEEARSLLRKAAKIADELSSKARDDPSLTPRSGAYEVLREANATLACFLADCPDPQFRDPRRALQLARTASDRAPSSLTTFVLGMAHYRNGDWDKVIEVLDQGGGSSPFILAMAQWKLGDRETARFHYDAAVSKYYSHPSYTDPDFQWWLRDHRRRVFDEASQVLGIEDNERAAMEAYWRGVSLLQNGELGAALDALRESTSRNPDHAAAYFQLGTALSEKGQVDSAIKALRRATDLQPKFAKAYFTLGTLLGKSGQTDAAIDALQTVVRLDSERTEAHLNLALCYGQEGDWKAAIAAYEEAVRLQPDQARELNAFAWFLATCPDQRFRNTARAVDLASRATDAAPSDGDVRNTLGVVQYRAGNYLAAVDTLLASMKLSEGGTAYDFFFLAMARWKLGERNEARDWFTKGAEWMKEHAPDDQELRQLLSEAAELLEAQLPQNSMK